MIQLIRNPDGTEQCPYCDHAPFSRGGWGGRHIQRSHRNMSELDELSEAQLMERTAQHVYALRRRWPSLDVMLRIQG